MTAFQAAMRTPIDVGPDAATTIRSAAKGGSGHADLALDDVSKFYGSVPAVRGMSLSADKGEFIAFLGPSGCGKSTTLAMIAGFQDVSSGSISIRGRRVDDLPPEKRNTGMVFQNYALFPHMSLAENVGFGLRMRNVPKDAIRSRVRGALALVKMDHLADRRPAQLSGGQQQRVALARALVIRPDILLLDEPLGALDRQLREQMQLEIKALQQSVGITTIFVTHDQEEALSMSERIVVMNGGAIEQVGTPSEIYDRPATRFVAQFIGKSNLIGGRIVSASDGRLLVDTAIGQVRAQGAGCAPGEDVDLLIRPEKMRVGEPANRTGEPRPSARASIRQVVFHGSSTEIHLVANGTLPLLVTQANETSGQSADKFRSGFEVEVTWPEEEMTVFSNGRRCS